MRMYIKNLDIFWCLWGFGFFMFFKVIGIDIDFIIL